jgi:hypothetical protein
LFAVVGVCSSGPLNTPAAYAKIKDIVAIYGQGPAVEAAAHYIERYGKPVLFVRTGNTTPGSVSAVTTVATGTAVVTITASPTPNDDYELVLKIIAGGTRGVAGITYQLSLDGGRTFGAVSALGTGTSITIPGAGGVIWAIGTGTLVAGDTFTARSVAPMFNSTEIGSALDALGLTVQAWELAHITGPIEGTTLAPAIDLKFAGFAASGKYHAWLGSARVPNVGETEAAYLTAIAALFTGFTTVYGVVYFGAIKLTSSVSGRKYKRPYAFAQAAREASLSEEQDSADVNLGALVGVSIRDSNGNIDEHDESANPGADDAGFCAARTWDGLQGVYCNRPRLMSPSGSDFQLLPHRRVLNLVHAALRQYFIRRCSKAILVNKATGFILESDALEIESGATAAMRAVALQKPKASDVTFVLSRTDNLLSTKTMNGQARVTPLAYPEFINLDVGFFNPALQVQAS